MSIQRDSIADNSRSVFARTSSVQLECTEATTRSAAARRVRGRSSLPSFRISTSMQGRTGHTGVARLRAFAWRSHRGGVRPPCSLALRLWSVTAKCASPLATTAVAIVFTEALPSDQAVFRCKSDLRSPWRSDANGSRACANSGILRCGSCPGLDSRVKVQPIWWLIRIRSPSCWESRRK